MGRLPGDDHGAPRDAVVKVKVLAVASIVGIVALVPFLAGARPETYPDPNDTRGRMDVKRIEVLGTDRVRYKIETYPRWKAADVRDRGFVVVFFDTFGNNRFDYYALVRSKGKRMNATLWRDRKRKKDYKVATLSTWRAGSQSVSVRVPISRMKWPETRAFYSWRVQTLFTGPECRRVCFDVVPDGGRVRVYRPGASPTPSPTETPGPTPTETPGPTPTETPGPTPTETPGPTPTETPP
jgi:hypothetical protein